MLYPLNCRILIIIAIITAFPILVFQLFHCQKSENIHTVIKRHYHNALLCESAAIQFQKKTIFGIMRMHPVHKFMLKKFLFSGLLV